MFVQSVPYCSSGHFVVQMVLPSLEDVLRAAAEGK
jgi:hypothetical protein